MRSHPKKKVLLHIATFKVVTTLQTNVAGPPYLVCWSSYTYSWWKKYFLKKTLFFSISLRFFSKNLHAFFKVEGKIFPHQRIMIGGSPREGSVQIREKIKKYSERSIQSAPSIVLMAPSMSYGIFLKILVASCSPNSSWNQSYEYFCRRFLIWSRNSSKSIEIHTLSHWGWSKIVNGFWWIFHFKWRAPTKWS